MPSVLDEARKRTKVVWLGKPIVILDQYALPKGYFEPFPVDILENIFNITRTQTRECTISSADDWIDFISDSCYSLNCEDGKNWTNIDGKKQLFLDWIITAKVRYDSKYVFERGRFLVDNVTITIVDTNKQKRLIVDGMHRAAALTMASETGVGVPDVKVTECYGDRIDVLFPCDAHQL